jgi:hypothetical protein
VGTCYTVAFRSGIGRKIGVCIKALPIDRLTSLLFSFLSTINIEKISRLAESAVGRVFFCIDVKIMFLDCVIGRRGMTMQVVSKSSPLYNGWIFDNRSQDLPQKPGGIKTRGKYV